MTTFLTKKPTVGDKVSVDSPKWGGIFTVKSTRGTANAKLVRDSDGAILNAPYSMLTEPTESASGPELYSPGEFIRIKTGQYAGLWIVTGDRGGDKVSLSKPGGGSLRLSATKGKSLIRVPAAEVLKDGVLL